MDWFSIDKAGLAAKARRNGMGFVFRELFANAVDEPITRVEMRLTQESRNTWLVTVEDDSPTGFRRLSDAWTMFARSYKDNEPTQRGRFDAGDKMVLACCEWAEIVTTTGAVMFDAAGRHQPRKRRERGSVFSGVFKLTGDEVQEIQEPVKRFIIPHGITAIWNGAVLPERPPLAECECCLDTEIADPATGILHGTRRNTTVRIYEPLPGCKAALYELGVPVIETGDTYDVDVQQKVPLTLDRENVRPAFLRDVRGWVVNVMAKRLDAEASRERWVTEGMAAKVCTPDAVGNVLDKRFGAKRASFDVSDRDANVRAQECGYTIVAGGSLPAEVWDKARDAALIQSAGAIAPSPKPFNPNGKPLKTVPEDEWTLPMKLACAYADRFARHAFGHGVHVVMSIDPQWRFYACYGDGRLVLSWLTVRKWCDGFTPLDAEWSKYDALLIHEFGHEGGTRHYTEQYYDNLCTLGAKMRTFADDARAFAKRMKSAE